MTPLKKSVIACLIIFLAGCGMSHTKHSQSDSNIPATAKAASGASIPGSGPDLYYELTNRTQTSNMDVSGTIEMYISPENGSRMEEKMIVPGMGEMDITAIMTMQDTSHYILLNEKKKQYSIHPIKTGNANAEPGSENYTVTKVGNETLHGFPCTHIKVTNGGTIYNIWVSKALPGYRLLNKMIKKAGGENDDALYGAIKKAGYNGFSIKTIETGKDDTTTADLTSVHYTTIPASMLQVPAGYTKVNGNASGMMGFGK